MPSMLQTYQAKLFLVPLASLLTLVAGCAIPSFTATKTYNWQFNPAAGLPVEIASSNGSIEIAPSADGAVTIDAKVTTYGTSQENANKLLEEQVPTAVQEENRIFANGRFETGINVRSPTIQYTVKVPAGTKLNLTSSNGSITVENIGGEVFAKTSNGAIKIVGAKVKLDLESSNGAISIAQSEGDISVKTSNGSIDADFVPSGAGANFKTSNGHITLALPKSIKAKLQADTSNGTIECNLPLTSDPSSTKKSVRGVIGSEASTTEALPLSIKTSNGRIVIKEQVIKEQVINEQVSNKQSETSTITEQSTVGTDTPPAATEKTEASEELR